MKSNKYLKVLAGVVLILFLLKGNLCAQNKVLEADNRLLITLANGVEIEFLKEGRFIKGIGVITCQGEKLRGKAYAMRPLIATLQGQGQYRGCEYDGWQEKDGGIIIKSRLIPKRQAKEDILEWRFHPVTAKVYQKTYRGLSCSYYFKSNNKDKAQRLLDRTSWELGGTADNLAIKELSGFGNAKIFAVSLDQGVNIPPSQRFFKEYNFNFQTGPKGSLFIYYQYPVSVESYLSKAPNSSWLNYFDLMDINLKEEFETPLKYVLFSSEAKGLKGLALEDEYCYVAEYVRRQQYAYFGAEAPGAGVPWIGACPFSDKSAISKWAAEGFQGIYFLITDGMNYASNDADNGRFVTVPFQQGGCGVWYPAIGPFFGGEDIFKDYCGEAAKHGMKVLVWEPSGYLGGRSPIVMKHPDWTGDYDDAYVRKYYQYYRRTTPLTIMDADSPYIGYFLKRYVQIRQRTGLSGLFQDSYQVGHTGASKVYKDGGYIVNVEKLAARDGALCKAGYFLSPEGGGPLGSPYWPVKLFDEKDYRCCYKWKILWSDSCNVSNKIDKNYWYMNLANGTGVAVSHYFLWGRKELDQKLRDWIIRANLDHKQVRGDMEWRHLIPDPANAEEPLGVEWRNSRNGNIVVFSFGEFKYALEKGCRTATDVTESAPVKDVSSGYLKTQPYHTYRIEK